MALAAGEQELAVPPADAIAIYWFNCSRFLEAVSLCRLVLAAFDDYRILGTIARAEEVLGDTVSPRMNNERALSGCPPSDELRKSATMHSLAGLEAQQGNVARAIELWQRSLEVKEHIGDLAKPARCTRWPG